MAAPVLFALVSPLTQLGLLGTLDGLFEIRPYPVDTTRADRSRRGQVSDPVELVGLEARRRFVDGVLETGASDDLRNGETIRFGDVVEVVARSETTAPAPVLHDEMRLAGQMPGRVPGKQPRPYVISRTGPGPDDDQDGLALIVRFRLGLGRSRSSRHRALKYPDRCRQHQGLTCPLHGVASLHLVRSYPCSGPEEDLLIRACSGPPAAASNSPSCRD